MSIDCSQKTLNFACGNIGQQMTAFSYDDVKQSLETLQAHPPQNSLVLNCSTIPEAGLGLFAVRRFKKGEPITEYYGQFITYCEATKRNQKKQDSHIRRHIAFRFCIDGAKMRDGTPITHPQQQLIGCGLAQYANHAEKGRKNKCNADFEFVDSEQNEQAMKRFFEGKPFSLEENQRITFIYATRDIEVGEEIFVDYGKDYWNKRIE